MADITGIFKSTVKMLKVRHKDLSAIKSGSGDEGTTASSNLLNMKSKKSGDSDQQFSARTRSIVSRRLLC